MISLTQVTPLPAAPERVWRLFEEMDAHYSDWHPEHLRWRTLRGQPLARGTVWFADEWVGPLRISTRFFVTDSQPPTFFSYRIGFPSSLGRAGGSFRFVPKGEAECELIQEVHFGFSVPVLGSQLDRVLRLALPVGEMGRHMREEQENLVGLLACGS